MKRAVKVDPRRARRAADCSNRLGRPARSADLVLRKVSLGLKALPAGGRFGDIKSLRLEELQEKLDELDEPKYRAGQVADWLYQKRVASFDEMTDLPQSLRAELRGNFRSTRSTSFACSDR